MKDIEGIKEHALGLIKEDKFEEAFKYLQQNLPPEFLEEQNKLILFMSRFRRLMHEKTAGLLKKDDIEHEFNSIKYSLTKFVECLVESDSEPKKYSIAKPKERNPLQLITLLLFLILLGIAYIIWKLQ